MMDLICLQIVNFVGGEPTPYLPFILKTLTEEFIRKNLTKL